MYAVERSLVGKTLISLIFLENRITGEIRRKSKEEDAVNSSLGHILRHSGRVRES